MSNKEFVLFVDSAMFDTIITKVLFSSYNKKYNQSILPLEL